MKVAGVVLMALLGAYWSMGTLFKGLWELWTSDGLRSIGMLIIPTSLLMCLHALRNFKTRAEGGGWWALCLCAVALILGRVIGMGPIGFHLNIESSIRLVPAGLIIWLYVTGIVVFFFGRQTYSRIWLPVALLLFVNPVPMFFERLVDLPLQYVAASTARWFARRLGTPLDPDRLKLMFSPALGMFVAPGCNGLRGAVAMGYLTLTIGTAKRLAGGVLALFVAGGIVFAYLCNLIRLCLLVICYKAALFIPFLADHMTAADYVIGGAIFLCAALLLVKWPPRLQTLAQ